jgi:hypothetical protein
MNGGLCIQNALRQTPHAIRLSFHHLRHLSFFNRAARFQIIHERRMHPKRFAPNATRHTRTDAFTVHFCYVGDFGPEFFLIFKNRVIVL